MALVNAPSTPILPVPKLKLVSAAWQPGKEISQGGDQEGRHMGSHVQVVGKQRRRMKLHAEDDFANHHRRRQQQDAPRILFSGRKVFVEIMVWPCFQRVGSVRWLMVWFQP